MHDNERLKRDLLRSIDLSTKHLGGYIKRVIGNEYQPLNSLAAEFVTQEDSEEEEEEGEVEGDDEEEE